MHYIVLYPQNGDRVVTVDSATSLHAMYWPLFSLECDVLTGHWGVRRMLVMEGQSVPSCRLRRRKFWKFEYEMVHSEVYLNKYVVSVAPFSIPTPFRKLLFFVCFCFLIFYPSFRGVSWPHLPLCVDAHGTIAVINRVGLMNVWNALSSTLNFVSLMF